MVWKAEAPQGNESAKVKYDVIPYMRGRGVDLGCGPWKIFPHCIGVDIIPGADVCARVTHLDQFASGSMDFVYSSHTLEDIEDTEGALREWWRLLKVGGFLILYLPHKEFYPNIGQPGGNPAHKHDFMPHDVIEVMRRIGGFDLKVKEDRNQNFEYSFLQVYQKLDPTEDPRYTYAKDKPAKTAAVVRYGAYGDALWASSPIALLKREGYHVTVYTEAAGHDMLKHDPNVDAFVIAEPYFMPAAEYLPYWLNESMKYDKWINLVQSVEATLLPQPGDIQFYWSDSLRAAKMNKNYLEQIHDFAEVPYEWGNQKFYPTEMERAWAEAFVNACPGRLVVINPTGSTLPKHWPHVQAMMDLLDANGIYSVVLGDLRDLKLVPPPKGRVIGKDWPLRTALAVCQQADVVIGTESVMVNAVAFEPMLKIVILSHSSHENLTKHWVNTICTEPDLACYPCHRIHRHWFFCAVDKNTRAAACQAVVSPEQLLNPIKVYFEHLDKEVSDELRDIPAIAS